MISSKYGQGFLQIGVLTLVLFLLMTVASISVFAGKTTGSRKFSLRTRTTPITYSYPTPNYFTPPYGTPSQASPNPSAPSYFTPTYYTPRSGK